MALSNLPRKHLRIGAAALFCFGLFMAAMTYLEADFVTRPHTGATYALADFSMWLVDLVGRVGAAIVFVLLGAGAALVLLRAGRSGAD